MKTKIIKLILISLTGVLSTLLITAQILITSTNFKWSPWYDVENGLGIAILTFHPKVIGIVLSILCINFLIKETRLNAEMILISVVSHIVLIFSFGLLNIGYFLFSMVLIGIIAISIILIIKISCSTIRNFCKIIKENY